MTCSKNIELSSYNKIFITIHIILQIISIINVFWIPNGFLVLIKFNQFKNLFITPRHIYRETKPTKERYTIILTSKHNI